MYFRLRYKKIFHDCPRISKISPLRLSKVTLVVLPACSSHRVGQTSKIIGETCCSCCSTRLSMGRYVAVSMTDIELTQGLHLFRSTSSNPTHRNSCFQACTVMFPNKHLGVESGCWPIKCTDAHWSLSIHAFDWSTHYRVTPTLACTRVKAGL